MEWHGSSQEANGGSHCEACIFFNSKVGCSLGDACGYSHTAHVAAPSKTRPRKQMRDNIKQRVLQIFSQAASLREQSDQLQAAVRGNPYAQGIIYGMLDPSGPGFVLQHQDFQSRWEPGVGMIISL
eukprot:Skav211674  [mRNA]  locus=scaffold216:164634:165011:+ [translate_table: standard]